MLVFLCILFYLTVAPLTKKKKIISLKITSLSAGKVGIGELT